MLEVENLDIDFKVDGRYINVVQKVSLSLNEGETLGLVGESGCGKTVTAHSLIGLLENSHTHVWAKKMSFKGQDLTSFSEKQWRKVRGNEISMIFQNPMTSLNPLMSCGRQIREVVLLHQKISRGEAKKKSIRLLRDMGIATPARRYDSFPHELSGGMRQRVMIGMALACTPRLLLADEPTTALDVTIQAQILSLIRQMQEKTGTALILITHDLGIVEDMVDQLMVMYAGQIIEKGKTRDVLSNPRHPYTQGLIRSIPGATGKVEARLKTIEGTVPTPAEYPDGCRFYARCHMHEDECRTLEYRFHGGGTHQSACRRWKRVGQ